MRTPDKAQVTSVIPETSGKMAGYQINIIMIQWCDCCSHPQAEIRSVGDGVI